LQDSKSLLQNLSIVEIIFARPISPFDCSPEKFSILAHIQQEKDERDDDASSIKSLSDISLLNMDIPSNKIDLESRKSSRKNRDLVEYFHNANNNFIDSLREHAKDKLKNSNCPPFSKCML